MSEFPLNDKVTAAINDALKGSGKINILIAGKTGVGKSTLVNCIFRGELAKTGSGKPVTQKVEEITKPSHPLTILDTKGLELKDYNETLSQLEYLIEERSNDHDENKHIHVAWVCILEASSRVEQAEIDLCNMLSSKGIPTIVAITKHRSDKGFSDEVRRLLPNVRDVIPVCAIREEIEDDDGNILVLPERNISTLINRTGELIPAAKKRAFANALSSKHKAALKLKIEQAEAEVNIAATAAAAAAAVPVPFSDAFTLVPIQVGMLAKIGITFGMDTSTATLTTLVTSIAGASAATMIGRTLVTGLLKMIPGVGSVAGGAIAATTAGALTKALGNAYISVLTSFCEKHPGKELDIDMIAEALKDKMGI